MESSPIFSIAPEVVAALDADILARLRSQAWRDAQRWVPMPENLWLFACRIGRTESLCEVSADEWCAIVADRLDALDHAGELHRHYRGARLGYVVPARRRNPSRTKIARRLTEFDRAWLREMLVLWTDEPETAAAGAGRGGRTERNRFLAQSEG